MKHSEALENLKKKQEENSKLIGEIETIVKHELQSSQKNLNGSLNKKLSIIRSDIRKSRCRPILIFLSGTLMSAGVMWLFLSVVQSPKNETVQYSKFQQEQ